MAYIVPMHVKPKFTYLLTPSICFRYYELICPGANYSGPAQILDTKGNWATISFKRCMRGKAIFCILGSSDDIKSDLWMP